MTRNDRLFQYLLWGQTTTPMRFKMLSEFVQWAADHRFNADQCKEVWVNFSSVYRLLYGNAGE